MTDDLKKSRESAIATRITNAELARIARQKKASSLEDDLWSQIERQGLSGRVLRQFRFAPDRKYRSDFASHSMSGYYLFEVEGSTWTQGRHTRGAGFELDCEKYNLAALLGYRVFRFTGAMVKDGRAIATIINALRSEVTE